MAEDVMTFDEILADPAYKSEFDRRVTKAISTVQSKLDAEIKKWEGTPTKEDYTSLLTERDTARTELTAAQAKIEQYEREKILISKGVTADDVDYYAFKIGKLVTEGKTFEQAAEDYFKENQPRKSGARVDTGGSLSGGNQPQTTNSFMNALIRGAR